MPKKSSGSVRVFYPRFNTQEVVLRVQQGLEALRRSLPVVRVVLFGSYAKGNYTVASDIDLLVVYRGPRREDAYNLVRRAVDLPRLEPHVYTEEEYAAIQKTLDRMTRGGRVIYPEE